jgi:hypothetical protein
MFQRLSKTYVTMATAILQMLNTSRRSNFFKLHMFCQEQGEGLLDEFLIDCNYGRRQYCIHHSYPVFIVAFLAPYFLITYICVDLSYWDIGFSYNTSRRTKFATWVLVLTTYSCLRFLAMFCYMNSVRQNVPNTTKFWKSQ